MITTDSVVTMTPRTDHSQVVRLVQESFAEYVTRLLEYWERVEPVNEYERRTR